MSFPSWVVSVELEDLYADAQGLGADGAVLSKERATRIFVGTKKNAGKDSHIRI
jgi:hypothetical protein